MKPITRFSLQLNSNFSLNADLTINKAGRYFLLNNCLLKVIQDNFYYAGEYLGKIKNGKFFPSFNLLSMLAKGKANKIVVERKAAWLFICGRDIFRKGIRSVSGSKRKGDHTLVINEFGECLGFGRIMHNLDEATMNEIAIKNISDIGDFLRREI